MGDTEKQIARILESYKTAVFAKDVAAFMRLYDPSVRVFDTWGVWSYEGAEAWQRAVEAWLNSLGTEKVKVTFEDVQTVAGDEFASVSAIVTYSGVAADGAPLRAMQNRITWALQTHRNVLRIVHEHTSAPVGFEDSRAILVRAKSP